jgi:hypothetical protein
MSRVYLTLMTIAEALTKIAKVQTFDGMGMQEVNANQKIKVFK